MRARTVGIFGSSVNPPTQAHVAIVSYFADIFDAVWMLPVYSHPYSTKRSLETFDHRVAMSRAAFSELPKVEVKRTEEAVYEAFCRKRGNVHESGDGVDAPEVPVTYDVISHIVDDLRSSSDANEKVEIHLIVGLDNFRDIVALKWKKVPELVGILSGIHVVDRDNGLLGAGATMPLSFEHGNADVSAHTVEVPIGVSSTAARDAIARQDAEAVARLIPLSVRRYVQTHGLYRAAAN